MASTTGKRYIITGAAGILGRHLVPALLQVGHQLCLIGRDEGRLAELQQLAPEQTSILACDLTDAGAAKAAVTSLAEHTGRIDGLIHLVGRFARGPFASSPLTSYSLALETNLFTALNITQPLLPYLSEQASLLYLSSFLAHDPVQNMGAYAVSKAALVTWASVLAREVSPEVRVNVLSTTMLDHPQARKRLPATTHPYLVDPLVLVETILFLLQPGSRGISGTMIPVYNHFQLRDTVFSS